MPTVELCSTSYIYFFFFFFNITENYLKLENLCHFKFSYLHNFIAQKKETKKKEEEN